MTEAWVDLHVHTYFSDGISSPSEVVKRASELGLKGIAIADHDTVDGLADAINAGKRHNIEVMKCVELSSQYAGKDVHILGYMMDVNHPRLTECLSLFCEERYRRAEKMVQNLNEQGVRIDMEEVTHKAKGRIIGRPHLAEILMEKGYVETFQESFYRYIGYGSKAYEDKFRMAPEKAIGLIAECGGLSFLAHPSSIISDDILLHLIKSGLDGIEIVHPKLTDERTRYLQKIAQNHGLLVSGGSDCHGGRNGYQTMGRYKVPYALMEEIKAEVGRRNAGAPA